MKNILLIFFTCSFVKLYAQIPEYKNLLFVGAGLSYPLNEFKEVKGGAASIGSVFNLSYSRKLIGPLSISINSMYAKNNVHKDAVVDYYRESRRTSYNFFVTPDGWNWKNVSLLAGPQLSIPLGPIIFDIKSLAGLGVLYSPPLHFDNQGMGIYNNLDRKVVSSFAFLLCSAIRLVSGHMTYAISAEYFQASDGTAPYFFEKNGECNQRIVQLNTLFILGFVF